MTVKENAKIMKLDSPKMAAMSIDARNNALKAAAKALFENKERIFEANMMDMKDGEAAGLMAPVLKRLKFDEAKLNGVIEGINQLIELDRKSVV